MGGGGGNFSAAGSTGGVSATVGADGGLALAELGSRAAVAVDDIEVVSSGFERAGCEVDVSGTAGSAIGVETLGAPAGCVHWGSGGGSAAGVPGGSVGVDIGATSAPVLDGAVTGRGTRATSIVSDLGVVTT
jgi:hypothetical protein